MIGATLRARIGAWLDRLWYGRPQTPRPPSYTGPPLWLGRLTPTTLLGTHQHQYDGRQTTPNDCAVACTAMLIHQALTLAGHRQVHVPYPALARAMDRAPLYGLGFYRVPFVGALPPGRAAAALRCLARAFVRHGQPRPWRVHLQGRCQADCLVRNLRQGYPTMIYGVWPNGMPHTVVVVGYDPATDHWHLLDPGHPAPYTGRPAFRVWSTAALYAWWGRRYFAYQRYTALWLSDIPQALGTRQAETLPTVALLPSA